MKKYLVVLLIFAVLVIFSILSFFSGEFFDGRALETFTGAIVFIFLIVCIILISLYLRQKKGL